MITIYNANNHPITVALTPTPDSREPKWIRTAEPLPSNSEHMIPEQIHHHKSPAIDREKIPCHIP